MKNESGVACYANAIMQAVLPLNAVKAALAAECDMSGNAGLVRKEVLRILRDEVRSCKDLINAVSNLDTAAAFMTPGLHHDPDEFFKLILSCLPDVNELFTFFCEEMRVYDRATTVKCLPDPDSMCGETTTNFTVENGLYLILGVDRTDQQRMLPLHLQPMQPLIDNLLEGEHVERVCAYCGDTALTKYFMQRARRDRVRCACLRSFARSLARSLGRWLGLWLRGRDRISKAAYDKLLMIIGQPEGQRLAGHAAAYALPPRAVFAA